MNGQIPIVLPFVNFFVVHLVPGPLGRPRYYRESFLAHCHLVTGKTYRKCGPITLMKIVEQRSRSSLVGG